jgi:hypothetical protein
MTMLALVDEFRLTAKQDEARHLFANDAMHTMLYGGARSAKTFAILRNIVSRAVWAPGSRHAAFRFRFAHIKGSVILDTFPKMMNLCFPEIGWHLNKQDWYVTFENGSELWFGGLDDKKRTDKVLGNEFATIFLNECSQISYGSYLTVLTRLAQKVSFEFAGDQYSLALKMLYDENPPTVGHWSHKLFIDKIEPESRRPVPDPENYQCLLMNPEDNRENLDASYLRTLDNMPARKRNRFYLGKFGDEGEQSLWTIEIIERSRVTELPELLRIIIAVDPSGADGDPEKTNDDIGIVVVGLGRDGIAYVLEDLTLNDRPAVWGQVVADAFERHDADRVIGEGNYGGAMVEETILGANRNIPYTMVTASRAKHIRAEPVSGLHEKGKIKLHGKFPDLEDELLNMTTAGYTGDKSPNRLDAFVFAVVNLIPRIGRKKKKSQPFNIPREEKGLGHRSKRGGRRFR